MTEKAGMTERVAILIVEDDNLQRRQMVRVLRAEGYEILQASDGNEAIRILLDQKVDAVLTDRKMPGMNGDDLVRYIKSNLSHVPVATVTAHPEEPNSLGPDATLMKPFGEAQLREFTRLLTAKKQT